MQPAITPYSVLLLLGAAQGLFLALALLNARGGNTVANRILASLTLVFALDLGDEFLYQARYYLAFPHLGGLEEATNFLFGPLAFLYVSAMTSPQPFRLTPKRWLHFVPFLASFALIAPYLALDAERKLRASYGELDVVDSHVVWAAVGLEIASIGSLVQIAIYIVMAILMLRRHASNVREQFSYTERVGLSWLRSVLLTLCLLYLIYFFGVVFAPGLGLNDTTENVIYVAVAVAIYVMGYLGLRQPAIFSRLTPVAVGSTEGSTSGSGNQRAWPMPKKYERSALNANLSEALLQELSVHMQTEQPYLDSDLTLPQLAAQLNITPNYLSQVINEQTGSNFFDYVNRHRVEATKKLLADPAQASTSILSIALESGFNSKSAFYAAFKKHTGVTAGQFRKEQRLLETT